VRDARRVCPDIVLVPTRHDAYVRLHREIVAAIDCVVPILGVRSIDKMVCTLSPGDQADPEAVGWAGKAGVARDVGPVLTCSVGLGPTELLAKIAAEMEKPDGLVVIRSEDLPGPLFRLGLTDTPGIARGNAARLKRVGVADVAGYWALAPNQARAI
jgi:DNA polymerase-4